MPHRLEARWSSRYWGRTVYLLTRRWAGLEEGLGVGRADDPLVSRSHPKFPVPAASVKTLRGK